MNEPATPAAPVAAPETPTPAPVAAPLAPTPAPQASPPTPTPAAPAPVKPPYVNPYAARPLAPKPEAPAAPVAAPPPAASPTPAEDPRLAMMTRDLEGLRSVVAISAQREVNALPESHRAYVLAQAGDDPVAQMRAVEALRAHGLLPSAPQVVPQGTTTLPAQPAPSPAPSPANPEASILATYEALRAKSPQVAANYYVANAAAITRARAARPS